jgi:putative FmdB family regulatory protein
MPIYEYKRPDGTTFEIVQSFSDDALTVDPESGVPVERVLHAPAVHFKGKGFYNTDYGTKRRQRENAAAAEKSSEKAAEKSSEKAAEKSSDSSSSSDSKSGASETTKKSETAEKDSKPVASKS